MSLGDYIDKRIKQLSAADAIRKVYATQTTEVGYGDFLGAQTRSGKVSDSAGNEYNSVLSGTPSFKDACVKLSDKSAYVVEEHVNFIWTENLEGGLLILTDFGGLSPYWPITARYYSDQPFWITKDGSDKFSFNPFTISGIGADPDGWLTHVLFSPDGKSLFCGGVIDHNPNRIDHYYELRFGYIKDFGLRKDTEVVTGDPIQGSFHLTYSEDDPPIPDHAPVPPGLSSSFSGASEYSDICNGIYGPNGRGQTETQQGSRSGSIFDDSENEEKWNTIFSNLGYPVIYFSITGRSHQYVFRQDEDGNLIVDYVCVYVENKAARTYLYDSEWGYSGGRLQENWRVSSGPEGSAEQRWSCFFSASQSSSASYTSPLFEDKCDIPYSTNGESDESDGGSPLCGTPYEHHDSWSYQFIDDACPFYLQAGIYSFNYCQEQGNFYNGLYRKSFAQNQNSAIGIAILPDLFSNPETTYSRKYLAESRMPITNYNKNLNTTFNQDFDYGGNCHWHSASNNDYSDSGFQVEWTNERIQDDLTTSDDIPAANEGFRVAYHGKTGESVILVHSEKAGSVVKFSPYDESGGGHPVAPLDGPKIIAFNDEESFLYPWPVDPLLETAKCLSTTVIEGCIADETTHTQHLKQWTKQEGEWNKTYQKDFTDIPEEATLVDFTARKSA